MAFISGGVIQWGIRKEAVGFITIPARHGTKPYLSFVRLVTPIRQGISPLRMMRQPRISARHGACRRLRSSLRLSAIAIHNGRGVI